MKPSSLAQSAYFMAPLSPSAHRLAQQFAQRQVDPQKAQGVYLNTLAVSAVEFYLRCVGVEPNRSASHSHDPIMQLMLDVADLEIPGKGKLECCPLLPNMSVLSIPPEVWSDRLAYIAVQFLPSLQAATLLGFAPAGSQEIALDQLRSLDDLAAYLDQTQPAATPGVNLSQWLENLFETGWQSLTMLTGLNQPRLATTFRNSSLLSETETRGAKLIDLGVQLGFESVALLVAITTLKPTMTELELEPCLEIWVQIHPTGETSCLPPDIVVSMLSTTGEILQAAKSRHQDNYIQLKRFRGTPGERFDIKVAFGEICTTESFVI